MRKTLWQSKAILLVLMAMLIANTTWTQEKLGCQDIIELIVKSINKQSAEEIKAHLATDFSMSGHQGEIAILILDQLVSQLGDTVISIDQISEQKNDDKTILKYNMVYEGLGEKVATFIFNKDGLIREMNLFDMQVKMMKSETSIETSDDHIIEVPFQMVGNLIAVDVLLNGQGRKFILDSGAPKVILNSRYSAKNEDFSKTISTSKGVAGSISGLDIDTIIQLDFYGIRMKDQEVMTFDLSHLEDELSYEFYGLIGYELIKDYDMIMDYDRRVLSFVTPDYYENYINDNYGNKEIKTIPMEMHGHIPIIELVINDMALNFGIDTGAETNLIHAELFGDLKETILNVDNTSLTGADNNQIEVKSGDIKEIAMGEKSFEKVPAIFSDISHLNKGYKLNLDGLIGYPILSRQITVLSFIRKELSFIN